MGEHRPGRGSPSTPMAASTTPLTQRDPCSGTGTKSPDDALSMAPVASADVQSNVQKWVDVDLQEFENTVAEAVHNVSSRLEDYIERELEIRIREEEALRDKFRARSEQMREVLARQQTKVESLWLINGPTDG